MQSDVEVDPLHGELRPRSRCRTVSFWVVAFALLAGAPGNAPAATSRLSGKVIDADTQKAIEGAEVELVNTSGGQGFFRARTGRDGTFEIDGISSDRYYGLTVSAPGYADFVIGAWQFPSPQRAVEVLVPLDRAGTIEVRVTKSDGRTPISGARVAVQRERGASWWEGFRPPPAPVFTGADGVARFVDLTAGYWTVTAEASGLRSAEIRRVAVRRGETTSVPVKLVRPAGLSGQVRLRDGSGVSGVTVTARGPSEGVSTTDGEGNFSVGDLEPGKYRVHVEHEGFEPAVSRESYALAEGESREGIVLEARPRPREMSFVLAHEAFPPETPVKLGLRSFRVGQIDVSVYEIPTALLLERDRDFRRLAAGADTSGLRRILSWSHATAAGPPWSWREEELAFPQLLPPGAYLLRGRAGDLVRRAILFVTDLGILVKRSASQVLVSAATLRGGRPVAGARIYLLPQATLAPIEKVESWTSSVAVARTPAGTTDEGGLVMLSSSVARRMRVVAVSEASGVSVVESPLAPAAEQGGNQAYLYTDRPLYRPGQTLYWKLFARKSTATGYAIPEATRVALSLSGPGDASVDMPPMGLNDRGSAHGVVVLPADAPLGEWTLHATAANASAQASLAVQEYRKPEFQVEVTPDREVYVNGDEVRFRVAASYFFGAPVFGATVRYNLFESRLRRDDEADEEIGDFEEEQPSGGYGRVLKTGETRTDVDGRAEISFTPERVAYDRRLTLEVEVMDGAGRVVSGRGSVIVGRGLFTISLRPMERVLLVGQAIPVEVRTRDHSGKPVSAAVTLELDQQTWNPLERRYSRSTRPLGSLTVTTNSEGRATASLTPSLARSGQLDIRARAEDAKGNRITAETSVWVVDARIAQYGYRYPVLEAFTDRERYQVGDTIRVLVNTEVKNAQVLATVEAREIYETRSPVLAGNTGLLSFVAKPEYAPNTFLAVHVRKGNEVHSRTLEISVEAQRHDLTIQLAADRDRYRPRDKGTIRIQTKDASGRPAPAEVSVGVVDEAIYALRPDNTPEPHDVFYGKRPNWVTTVVAFPALYFGGVSKGGREEVRRDFRDVALWQPMVLTDSTGRAEVTVEFPDNLTTWRVTSRGATLSTLVGKAVAKVLVTKELVARLAGPRFFVAGDEASLVSTVNNRSPEPVLGVEQSIEARGPVSLEGAAGARTNLSAGGEGRQEWRVRVSGDLPREADAPPDAVFTFHARAKVDSDALEVPVPVKARAVPLEVTGGGRADGAEETATVALPGDLVRPGSRMLLDFAPSPAALALSAVDYLIGYPYGCTEQTANAILPAATLLPALRTAGVTPPGWEDAAKKLLPYAQRLAALQNPEGGWGWWREGESDPYLTALALHGLAAMSQLTGPGSEVDFPLARGSGYALRLLSEVRNLDGEAYVLAHLSPLLALPDADNRFPGLREQLEEVSLGVFSGRDRLGTSGLALATRVLAEIGKSAEARTLLDLLLARAQRDALGLHWPADPGFEDSWFGEEVENTAYGLSALSAVDSSDARAGDAVRWLAARRRGTFWRSTRVTGPAALALAEYLARRPGEVRPQYHLRVQWNGEPVLERDVNPANAFGGDTLRVRLGGSKLVAGDNRLAIAKQGSGSVYYGWEGRALVPSPGPPASDTRLRIAREYLRAERTTDRRGRPRYLTSALAPNDGLRVGESILVRLTLTASKPLRYLVVEDPRVAGFEIDRVLPEGAEWPYGTHAEERDDRAVFFLDDLEQGETTLEYLVRPELAGSFTALPTSGRGMYDPDLSARSSEARLRVIAK